MSLSTLPPHLHLLVPSSTPSILLDVRLYPFPCPPDLAGLLRPNDRLPTPEQVAPTVIDALQAFGAQRLITGNHPWGQLGGSQLDPILTEHLLDSVKAHSAKSDTRTVVLTYNVRGIGASHGRAPWLLGSDPADLTALEKWAVDLLSVREIKRLGYSWGGISSALAPTHPLVRSVLLIAPPLAFIPAVTMFSSPSFPSCIETFLSSSVKGKGHAHAHAHGRGASTNSIPSAALPAPDSGSQPRAQDTDPDDLSPPATREGGPVDSGVWAIWGSSDQFTAASRFQGWVLKNPGMRWKEVQGDHFFRWDLQSEELRMFIGQWLDA